MSKQFVVQYHGVGITALALQLPLREAHAPQARGVHERLRHGEAPTVADAVIETEQSSLNSGKD